MEIKRNGFSFYLSYAEVVEDFNDENMSQEELDILELNWYRGIIKKALFNMEPNFTDRTLKLAWRNVAPVLEKNIQLFKNGVRGGRPNDKQNITKEKPNDKQTITKVKPNDNQSITKVKPNDNQTITKKKPYKYKYKDIYKENNNTCTDDDIDKTNCARACEEKSSSDFKQDFEKVKKLKELFPNLKIGKAFLPGQNVDLLIEKIKGSDYLLNFENANTNWFVKNYDDILADKYKTFGQKQIKLKSQYSSRKYSEKELEGLFDNLEDIEV